MQLCRNCIALGVFAIMTLAGIARADSAGEQGEPLSPSIRIMDRPQYANARWGLLQVDAASGRVEGDLVLVGSGDLTWADEPSPTGRSIGRTPITATPMPFLAPH
jgi:hypothetical protein